jgi:hypothetical protein
LVLEVVLELVQPMQEVLVVAQDLATYLLQVVVEVLLLTVAQEQMETVVH